MNLGRAPVVMSLAVSLLAACGGYDPAASGQDESVGDSASAWTTCPAVDYDFAYRDTLPQTDGTSDSFGRRAATYPSVISCGTVLFRGWYRNRIIAAARHFNGTPYAHHHIPADGGLDCSNFTAWVYNYAGIKKFGSSVKTQGQELLADGEKKISSWEDLKMGDITYQYASDGSGTIGHAAIFIDSTTVIDSTSGKVVGDRTNVTSNSWYRTRFAFGVRIIADDVRIPLPPH